jgi:hypothetical protein
VYTWAVPPGLLGKASEASRKRGERGGFDQRIFLEYVDQSR